MIYKIDTDQLADLITERLDMGFTLDDSVYFTMLMYPPTQSAIFEAARRQEKKAHPLSDSPPEKRRE